MFVKKIGVIVGLVSVCVAAVALDIKTYQEMRKGPIGSEAATLLKVHMAGLAEGFSWANAHLEAKGQPLIFCAPRNLTLNPENYMQILDEEIAKDREKYSAQGAPVGGVLLIALQRKLPCTAESR